MSSRPWASFVETIMVLRAELLRFGESLISNLPGCKSIGIPVSGPAPHSNDG
ncbi:predicted protein [Plenodomus lingam JN3]|uniref:Predicted protein n=1 Tax=Leptosphaeria maculans (strain JN3 / isolate v23.1.3 / race Av1-4-5-6-7-8) TaxID=985895 RepID=E4ZWJ1_LEPMJ|nr:predicted protein [Plenodomus lingam JN3]CBX95967.1 predicted protein [Plenodomus lingam JN3]